MKNNHFLSLLIAATVMLFSSCDKFGNPYYGDDTSTDINQLKGIVQLNSNIGNWDAAYLCKYGYFTYSEKFGGDNIYSSISYMSNNEKEIVSLISTKKEKLPSQMVIKDNGIIYFSFPNDTIVELIFDNGKEVSLLGSYLYPKKNLPGVTEIEDEDVFKSVLANTAALLKANTPSQTRALSGKSVADKYANIFEEVSTQSYTEDLEAVAGLSRSTTGDYKFTETISEWYDDEIGVYVCNTLSIWTGKATYKVGGSSCTLSGTIWCPSNTYNTYGTYGIVCDEDKSKLTLGNAEYEEAGYQPEDKLSYDVDFRGFKPNTTYYYRAYYKFNSTNHGNITAKYGNPDDQVIYDTTIKSFKTGDNILSVDVVMCIDCTGSMSGIINTVKKNAISFYDSFKNACDEEGISLSGLNAQVVAFRDKNEDSNWLQTSATYWLPDNKTQFDSFVNGLYADGGGDTPESGLEALQTAFNKTDWSVDDGYHRQVVILWTDAPYLIGSYSSVSLSSLATQWNSMPSGRRLILFAPYGTDGSNSGSWGNLDGWKNVIHESDLSSGFNNFDYILKSIIGELTSKAKARAAKATVQESTYFRPNK